MVKNRPVEQDRVWGEGCWWEGVEGKTSHLAGHLDRDWEDVKKPINSH